MRDLRIRENPSFLGSRNPIVSISIGKIHFAFSSCIIKRKPKKKDVRDYVGPRRSRHLLCPLSDINILQETCGALFTQSLT